MTTEEQFAKAIFEKRNRGRYEPGFTLRIAGLQLIRVLPFLGAGWAWPYAHCKKWQIGFYFHCRRGLYIGFGWNATDHRVKRWIKSMTPQERKELLVLLEERKELLVLLGELLP